MKKQLNLTTNHSSLVETIAVSWVNHVDKDISVLEIIPPVRSNASLATYVPHIQFESLRLDALDVETL